MSHKETEQRIRSSDVGDHTQQEMVSQVVENLDTYWEKVVEVLQQLHDDTFLFDEKNNASQFSCLWPDKDDMDVAHRMTVTFYDEEVARLDIEITNFVRDTNGWSRSSLVSFSHVENREETISMFDRYGDVTFVRDAAGYICNIDSYLYSTNVWYLNKDTQKPLPIFALDCLACIEQSATALADLNLQHFYRLGLADAASDSLPRIFRELGNK